MARQDHSGQAQSKLRKGKQGWLGGLHQMESILKNPRIQNAEQSRILVVFDIDRTNPQTNPLMANLQTDEYRIAPNRRVFLLSNPVGRTEVQLFGLLRDL